MRIIRVANREIIRETSFDKEGGIFDWFKKEEPEVRTPEDKLVEHFENRIKPKVISEMKRVGNLDNYSPNQSHFKFLIGTIKSSLKEMFHVYDRSKHWSEDPEEKQIVEKILIKDPEQSLDSFSASLEEYLQDALAAKEGGDPVGYRMALKTYQDALHRLYSLLYEFAENYFSALGRRDVFDK